METNRKGRFVVVAWVTCYFTVAQGRPTDPYHADLEALLDEQAQ